MKYFSFFLILLSASRISYENANFYFVVWNVGQGQWTTYIQNDRCLHFDIGGEFFPWKKVEKLCSGKINHIYLTHWDWDHLGGLKKASKNLSDLCLFKAPLGKPSAKKSALLPRKICSVLNDVRVWSPERGTDTNSLSRVFSYKNILIPGDSPVGQEKIWLHQLEVQRIRLLVLGHHGSRTSTSPELLDRLPKLKQAISSARWARYRHPHPQVLALLKTKKIPILRTQDWGNIWFEQTYFR